jgi:hypothetical protein
MPKANVGDVIFYRNPHNQYFAWYVTHHNADGDNVCTQFVPNTHTVGIINTQRDHLTNAENEDDYLVGKPIYHIQTSGGEWNTGEINVVTSRIPGNFAGVWRGQFSDNLAEIASFFDEPDTHYLEPSDAAIIVTPPVEELTEMTQPVGAFKTREEWLNAALELVIMDVSMIFDVPDKLRISTGFPSTRATTLKSTAIGQCWKPAASNDHTTEIFVSPILSDPFAVLEVITHEVGHAVNFLQGADGHGKEFRAYAKQIGLEGPMTNTHAGQALRARLDEFVAQLGPYPHASLNPAGSGRTKAKTRLLKAYCPHCSTIMRVTAAHIKPDLPICWKKSCQNYQQEMTVEVPADDNA